MVKWWQSIQKACYPTVLDSGPLANLLWEQVKNNTFDVQDIVKVKTYFIATHLVKHGAGICIVDEFTARAQRSELVGIAELDEPVFYPIKGLHLDNKSLSKVTQHFIEVIKSSFN